ncbi:S1 domain-containing RNA-binding protein [Salisediminibacterium selenitireducens]|uniref:RNA binding S1 domain protein n=1 Tax=Bacillus selenitireducens (strain ATCC 700615 / DSM 15326 / MLS10) TaxID=439292 RepID=D6XV54_BACIE|nr:S1 domain-containing RNA-binding protein [Salisediminibacterium selenitireducens]ADH97612.1 RNA binding S1 domain protein [[Bacillus] selenitireducens MLS10]
MSIEIGSKVEGKITGITHFGAFVELPGKKTGLVHISEVADGYVENIKDVLTVGDTVTVKVLKIADDGKIALSIRKAAEKPAGEKPRRRPPGKPSGGDRRQEGTKGSFEDKMSRFLKDSEERLSTLRKQTDSKRGGRSTKR